jgi:two-component system phosphate regulon sensor histidine kinase PhoR
MYEKLRRRIVGPILLLVLIIVVSLWLYVGRPGCDTACVRQGILVSGILSAGLGLILAHLLSRRLNLPLQNLQTLANQIRDGQRHSHIIAGQSDEMGQLVHAFNEMAEQLDERLATLTQEQQLLELVLNQMGDGLLFADSSGRVTLINPAAARILSTEESVVIGRSVAETVRHHDLIDLWQHCRQSGREQSMAVEVGADLFLQAVITPFKDNDASGYLLILQDLTHIRHLQTIRRDFISNISHELRTPLASLRAVVETLRDGALDDPPAANRFLERAEIEVDTLTQMVEELLELSRIESGQVPLKLARTAVPDLFFDPMERLQSQAERSEIELVLDLPLGLPLVLADAARVQQVIANLLHNAIKFSAAGDAITVCAELAERGTAVLFSVKDDGIGITPADLPRIFERFYKSDRARTRSRGGTGLGLAIARHIVQAHNGRIWATSKEGKGSTFYFTLPVAE